VALGTTVSVGARVTRQSGTSFYYAFLVLPEEKRRALYALYAFCRAVDDCVDEEGGEGEAGLGRWLAEVQRAYAGAPETELGRELAEAVARFPVPRGCFEDVVAGCRMDLTTRRYATFADLRVYCERVASAVGLASIEIFGYDDPRTREYAVELGLALQLTNILRDVGTDAARDRLYLPLEDLAASGVTEGDVLGAARGAGAAWGADTPRPPGLERLLAFEADRARSHYVAASTVLPEQDRRSMLAAEIMGAIYRGVLEEWARRGHPIGGARVQLGKARKMALALRTIPRVYWGV
jgi:phytoene synthase